MINLRYAISLILCLLFIMAKGQSSKEFVDGYIISSSGDTLRGQIKDESLDILSKMVLFRQNESATVQAFSPNDVSKFFFSPSFHFESIYNEKYKEKLFHRQLVEGDLDAFSLVIDREKTFCFRKLNGDKLFIEKNDSLAGITVIKDIKFIGQLKLFLRDCDKLTRQESAFKYNQKAIRKLVMKYNKCIGSESINLRKTRPLHISASILTGIKREKLKASVAILGTFPFEVTDINFRSGILVDFQFFKRITISTGILHNNTKTTAINEFSLGKRFADLNYSTLEVPISLKYNLYSGRVSPFLNLSSRIGIYRQVELVQTKEVLGMIEDDLSLDSFIKSNFGFDIGIGARSYLSENVLISVVLNSISTTFIYDITEFWSTNGFGLDLILTYRIN